MGRREVPLARGVVGEFAAGLRDLRIKAGQPTYRQLARASHFSSATLARAASGRAMPSLEVTLAYVVACEGDAAEWRNRWEVTQRQALATDIIPGEAAADADPDAPLPATISETQTPDGQNPASEAPKARSREVRRTGLRILTLLSLIANVILGSVIVFSNSAPRPPTVAVEDGTDPKASHCDDGRTLDSHPVVLSRAARIGGRTIPAGTSLGTVTLRFSAHCVGAWARYDPAPNMFGNPNQGTVTIQATRPAEGAQATFRLGHIDQTYSDLLLTGMGCVTAHVTVTIADGSTTADGGTACLPRM